MDLQSLCVTIGKKAEIPDAYIAKVSDAVASAIRPLTAVVVEGLGDVIPRAEAAINGYLPPSKLTAQLPLLTVEGVVMALVLYAAAMLLCLIISRVVKSKWTLLGTIHNTAMIALSAYMGLGIAITAYGCGIRGWNNAVGTDAGARRLAKLIWLFYVSKVFEFTDTLLMILKRNYRQVTILHVYHHVSVFIIWLLVARWAPGGEAYFSSSMNCGIHVMMYTYYHLNVVFTQGAVRNFLQKWKHLITVCQMLQLSLNAVQAAYDLYIVPRESVRYPPEMMQLLFWYMLSLLVLFANFLSKDRARLSRQKTVAPAKRETATKAPKEAAAIDAHKKAALSPPSKSQEARTSQAAKGGVKAAKASPTKAEPETKKGKNRTK